MMRSRSWRRHGAWAALFALSLQLVLAFGHTHPLVAAQDLVPAATSPHSSGGDPVKKSSDAAQDICAICVVIHLANTTVLPPPVPLALPVRSSDSVGFSGSRSVQPRLPPHPFQTRAPPIA